MAHQESGKKSSLATVYIVVILGIIVLSLLSRSFSETPPPVVTHVKSPNPLPQQTLNRGGHKSTVLSFVDASSSSTMIATKVGEIVPLQFKIDPGQNLVSFVKVDIVYDPTKLAPVKQNGFQPEGAMSSILDGPVYTRGKISVTMSIGADPTRALAKPATAATVSFKALVPTKEGESTPVTFGPATEVLSLASNDSASENVLSAANPANITISR